MPSSFLTPRSLCQGFVRIFPEQHDSSAWDRQRLPRVTGQIFVAATDPAGGLR